MIYVLYHAHCTDGFGAAFAAWKRFGDNAKYLPVSYANPLPNMKNAKAVYILDFSYDKQTLLELKKKADVVVLDHHKTAEKDLQGLSFAQFDMERSGAMMAWEYFHPEKEVPLMIQYIQDRDLWKFDLKLSKEFHLGISSIPQVFEVWDVASVDDLTRSGSAILSYQSSLVERIASASVVESLDSLYGHPLGRSYNVVSVNSGVLESEVGDALLHKFPDAHFALIWYRTKEGKTKVSLRSEKGKTDVSEIAKFFSGGGHPSASGFVV
jgi:nanoRNase/pAp phosphatase (c-di-AMP/oligoRNAs hydrolase)